ncbi:DUF6123 family protein [Jeotgalibacillus soli]|uniref:Uncharacterized protein n=1 Tax=Jeotgalibacillus soli TaxID=889306 RepID=A0A0C2VI18_9BACL|nr:DUF6123 family protein [Jeotgalibacillus soli]KIL44151.1 hypothetical protein KP78_31150 [Jeotgalibacillus soli]
MKHQSLEDFLADLETKGFKLGDEAIGFIYFGRKYTEASDIIIQVAIEVTLKVQQRFDSSFYMSVLEELVRTKYKSRGTMLKHFKDKGIKM